MDRYKNACRICIKDDGIQIPIFGEEGEYRRVASKIKQCLNVPIYPNDPLPKQVCHRCFYKLELASEVKETCQQTNAVFIHHLKSTRGNSAARDYLNLVEEHPHQVVSPQQSQGQKRKLPGSLDSSEPIRKRSILLSQLQAPPNPKSDELVPPPDQIISTGGPFYICELCDKGFLYKHALGLHKHRVHGLQMLPASELPQQVLLPPPSPTPSSSKPEDDSSRLEDSEQASPVMPRLKPQLTLVSVPIETATTSDEVTTRNNDNPPTSSDKHKNKTPPPKTINKSNHNRDAILTPSKASSSTVSSESKDVSDDAERSSARPRLSLGKTLGGGYKCEYCGGGFGNNGSLVIHKIRKHGFQTESMKTKKAKNFSATPKTNNKRLSISPKSKSPNKTKNSPPINKPTPVVKSKLPSAFVVPQVKKSTEKSLPQVASSSKQQETEALWYENESHECEVCFRVLRSWTKFVEHTKAIHNFTPKPPSPDKAPKETSKPEDETPSIPLQNGIDAVADENIQTEVINIPKASEEVLNIAKVSTEVINTPKAKIISSSPITEKKFECPVCHIKFQRKIGLNIHCRNQHDKHICSDCNDYFDSRDDLEIHILTHELQEQVNNTLQSNVEVDTVTENVTEPEKPVAKAKEAETKSIVKHECLYCDTSYAQKQKLSMHYTEKHNLHFCTICYNGFKSSLNLETHKSEDHKNNNEQFNNPINSSSKDALSTDNVKCKSCNLQFKFRSSLFLHIRQIHNMKFCTLCLDLVSEDQFAKHKSHCLDPRLSCMICKISFKTDRSLTLHMAREHPKKLANTVSVDEKEKEKTPEINRVKHTSKNPICLQCKQKFNSSSELWNHLKDMHPALPRHRCSNCQNVFYSSGGLAKHKVKCTSDHNSKSARDSDSDTAEEKETPDNYSADLDEEEVEDTMICPVSHCRKRFNSTWQNVNRHIKDVHNPSYLKECTYCIKLFIDEEKLKEHEKLHVLIPDEIQKIGNIPMKHAFKFAVSDFAEPKHICKICNTKFFTSTMLNDHNAAKHAKEKNRDRSTTPSSDHSVQHRTASRNKKAGSYKRVLQISSDDDSDSTSFSAKRTKAELLTSKQIKKKVNCKYCTEEFNNFVELLPHIESNHSSSVYLKCENCDEIYYDFGNLNKHVQETHPKLSLNCSYCSRCFTREVNKVSHEVVCSKRPVEPASSEDNDSDSSRSSGSSSSSESPIPNCSLCGARFTTPELLADHLREHAKRRI